MTIYVFKIRPALEKKRYFIPIFSISPRPNWICPMIVRIKFKSRQVYLLYTANISPIRLLMYTNKRFFF